MMFLIIFFMRFSIIRIFFMKWNNIFLGFLIGDSLKRFSGEILFGE